MDYKIVLTENAQYELEMCIQYLLVEKKNIQAAQSFLHDFETTKTTLNNVAEVLQFCRNKRLKKLGYRRINFQKHKYFMLYRVEDKQIIVDGVFHNTQDYERRLF